MAHFRRCVKRYDGEHKVLSFRCTEQYRCMAFAQLTYRESLRDITCAVELPHMGIKRSVKKHTGCQQNAGGESMLILHSG